MGRFSTAESRRQKVLIIGAGPAGMSCAEMLSREPDKYLVTILERGSSVGGQASSVPIDGSKYGADWVNEIIQFASPNSHHTFQILQQYGYNARELGHHVAFGKGKENFWTNVFPTSVGRRHENDIRRFGKLLKLMSLYPPRLFWSIPLKTFLFLCGFDKEFGEKIIYPLASSLIPIGNQSSNIPVGLAQWIFEQGRRNIWDYDAEPGLPNIPTVYTFPNLGKFYQDWAEGLRAKGVKIRLNTQAVGVVQRDKSGIVVETRSLEADPRLADEGCQDRNITEVFDKLVICIPGDQAKGILGKQATLTEKLVLGCSESFDDLEVIHSDSSYIQRNYETNFKEELCAQARTVQEEERIKSAKGEMGINSGYKPAYLTFSYNTRPDKIEATGDCSRWQYQFIREDGNSASPIQPDKHIFQSHFMDEKLRHLWTVDQINEKEILRRTWWRVPLQTWKHWIRVVPWLEYINGTNNTFYAGGWTMANIQETACTSGIAAAYRIGVPYEGFDDIAESNFRVYLRVCHGKKFKKTKQKPGK